MCWALIDHDWCPHKKRTFRHRELQTEDHVKTQVRKRKTTSQFLHRKPTLPIPWSQSSSLKNYEKHFCCLSHQSGLLVMITLANFTIEDFAIDISPGNTVKEFDELRWRVVRYWIKLEDVQEKKKKGQVILNELEDLNFLGWQKRSNIHYKGIKSKVHLWKETYLNLNYLHFRSNFLDGQ